MKLLSFGAFCYTSTGIVSCKLYYMQLGARPFSDRRRNLASVKGQAVSTLGFAGIWSWLQLLNSTLWPIIRERQNVKEWIWQSSKMLLFIKTGRGQIWPLGHSLPTSAIEQAYKFFFLQNPNFSLSPCLPPPILLEETTRPIVICHDVSTSLWQSAKTHLSPVHWT